MIGPLLRIILFVPDVPTVAAFYRDVLGLKVVGQIDPGWTELKAGKCFLALHKAGSQKTAANNSGSPAKIVFAVKDVPKAKALVESRGGKMGKIITFKDLIMCDGQDPAGNPFQLSNRGM